MNIEIQSEYQVYIPTEQLQNLKEFEAAFCIGDLDFITARNFTNTKTHKILITNHQPMTADQLRQANPTCIFVLSEVQKSNIGILDSISLIAKKAETLKKIAAIKQSVDQKKTELERLNTFLIDQTDEKKTALSHFHNEELSKKNKEKKLLYFLDYINSEYKNSDFILDVLKSIWSDVKKIGTFYRLGFILQNQTGQSYVIEFDGMIDHAKNPNYEKNLSPSEIAQYLANIFKRPICKLIHYSTEKDDHQFIFYFESQNQDYKLDDLNSYMQERISLLSIVMQRWYLESKETQILKQWQQIFKSYKNAVHVIDDEYNLVQSNYTELDSAGASLKIFKKCYQVLAKNNSPCRGCPLQINKLDGLASSKIHFNNTDFEIIKSEFTIDEKKYFFMIYENVTDMNVLRSNSIQAEKMATLGQLSNHLAHELNNPLTGLKLYSEMLLTENKLQNPIYENDMCEVLKAISRSQMILQDLSQFASEEKTDLIYLDFSEMVKKTMTLLKSVLRNHRIFIDLKNTQVLMQPTYVQQILFNLIKNACQAMPEKGILKIYQIENLSTIDFVVEDDGPGLTQAMQEQVFKPFSTTKNSGQGTGLGLYISHKLMQRMSAELIYDFEFKKGTKFVLRFKKQQDV